MKSESLGVLVAFIGVCAVSSDGLLVKLAAQEDASVAAILFFKSISGFIVVSLIILAEATIRVGPRIWCGKVWRSLTRMGLIHLLVAGTTNFVVLAGFTLAFQYTTSANVLSFTALSPIWASLLTRPVLGEAVPPRTIVANVLALLGSAIVVVGISLAGDQGEHELSESIVGTVIAVFTGFGAAGIAVTMRSAASRAPDTPMIIGMLLGLVLSALLGLGIYPDLHPDGADFVPEWRGLRWVILNGGVCMAITITAYTMLEASFLVSAELTLIMQMEGLLGPLSVYAALNEVPLTTTLTGGALILTTVMTHEGFSLKANSARTTEDPSAVKVQSVPKAVEEAEDISKANLSNVPTAVDAAEAPPEAII
eukprot:CAMPEP_0170572000 /NCGR_PEP_ID=MMETSP0224-20130122/1979_1 /TAXON_ID=285029 /ORGANISM="Togula jolla, Strain CCCM 725" /LENGTH=366 /DNA_ID=CAMNT_0010894453 /DNA_START=1 /DNA_END=1102 /DNA_ORIENTATION=-